jgi:hypothetical protein
MFLTAQGHLMVGISRTLEARDGFQELQGWIHAFLGIPTIRCGYIRRFYEI